MKTIRNLIFAVAAIAFALSAVPSYAGSMQLCAGSNGSKRVTNPNTNNSYTLNGRGCGLIAAADVAYFQSQGYSSVGEFASVIAAGATVPGSVIIPAGAYIRDIIAQETSGASLTGGLKVGTTSGGTDVMSMMVLSASTINVAKDVSFGTRAFSSSAPQTLFFGPVTAFNSAAITVTVVYGFF